jgi:hypothetical protein
MTKATAAKLLPGSWRTKVPIDPAGTLAEATRLLAAYHYGMVLVDWCLPDGDVAVVANLAAEFGSHAFVMSGYLMRPGTSPPNHH